MNIPEEAVEAVKSVLRDEGLDETGGNPHSWRCEFPDLYPNHCTCADDLARAALEAAAPLLMAQALRQAARDLSWFGAQGNTVEPNTAWAGVQACMNALNYKADEMEK